MKPVVYVFVQDGCPACEEFLPRITRVSQPLRAAGLEVFAVNIRGERGGRLAQGLKIEATPTTVIVQGSRKKRSVVGAVDDQAIAALLASVNRG